MTAAAEVRLSAPLLSDVPGITTLINRSEAFDGLPRVVQADEMLEELTDPHLDLDRDCRIAVVDGEIIGWIRLRHAPSGQWLERAVLDGNVDPRYRRRGIGTSLMEWGVAKARQRLSEIDNDLPKSIRTYTYEQCADALRLIARFDFADVRWFDDLLRPLVDLPPAIDPPGVAIFAWPTGRDEEIRAVKNAAFADHWGSVPLSAEDWEGWVMGFGSRTDLSFVAADASTGELIGHCLNMYYSADEALLGRRDGWIDNLGTVAAWRGRGVASAMIVRSLHAFVGAGFTHASINVDSDSPTGASRLYRGLGFEPEGRQIVAEIQVGETRVPQIQVH